MRESERSAYVRCTSARASAFFTGARRQVRTYTSLARLPVVVLASVHVALMSSGIVDGIAPEWRGQWRPAETTCAEEDDPRSFS
jgi:hypothetical protein